MSFILALAVFLAAPLLVPAPAGAIAPDPADYYAAPPLMIGGTKPAILMILAKDQKMFAPAYAAPADHDGDGRTDVGFNPALEYTGIFDPYSCYTYTTDSGGYFYRIGASTPDVPDASGPYPDSSRLPDEIKNGYQNSENARPGYRAPRSKTGVCPQRRDPGGLVKLTSHDLIWSGNWLNWITSSRIDVIRQILYGGKRVVDTAAQTFLTVESIPENAGVWAYDDFTKYYWLDYNEGSPYYDTLLYTPVDPDRFGGKYRRLHAYGRAGTRLYVIDNIWFMRQKEDVLNHEGFRSYNAFYPSRDRAQYAPIDYVLNSFADKYKTAEFNVRVLACVKATKEYLYSEYYGHIIGRTDTKKYKGRVPANAAGIPDAALLEAGDYCERYGSYYKPAGILQKYTQMDQALFGLMTGAFSGANRWDAGWLRQNVASIRNHINSDGTFKGDSTNNIFRMLDAIAPAAQSPLTPLTEKGAADTAAKNLGKGWRDPQESTFGNPVGEMLYAGLLYFARTSKSSYAYWPSSLMENSEDVNLPRLGAGGFDNWRSPLAVDTGDCLKPVILLLSDISPSHDGDLLPGTPHGTNGTAPALSLPFPDQAAFNDAKGLGPVFNMSHYLAVITELEGFQGKTYYLANTNTGGPAAVREGGTSRQPAGPDDTNLCIPRVLNNLADVRGLCPSAPQTYGTYSVAAAAYYGNTHAFDGGMNNVQTYVVALPSIFPEIRLESKKRVISISPTALSVQYPCGNNGEGDTTYCKGTDGSPEGISFLGPFAANVIQWRADDQGRVYSGAVFAGFSNKLEGEGGDYQLDAPVRYYFDLIRECLPSENCGGAMTGSFRYENKSTGGSPSVGTEQAAARAYLGQSKYTSLYGYSLSADSKSYRDLVNGWGGKAERDIAKRILLDFKDGRYAGAPVKRRREFVYRSWDSAQRPNYILSGERPKYYDKSAYTPANWTQTAAILMVGTGILNSDVDPDPALIESYALSFYGSLSNANRQTAMRTLPGASAYKYSNTDASVDYAPADESKSLFLDRPFADLRYGEVMDVYGYIGEPGRIYKKVTKPEEIDDAVGAAVFVYSLYEEIDGSDRDRPMNIGYYIHGGLNFAESKEDNPSRILGTANGTYLEIQNEHNYMGGSSYTLKNGTSTAAKNRGLMTVAHELNTPPTCFRAGQISTKPMNFTAADRAGKFFKNNNPANLQMPGFTADTDATAHAVSIPGCGSARLPLTATRFFRFPDSASSIPEPAYLPNPLWLAAKYGGFNDINRDGVPQKNEWDSSPGPSGDGIPDNYFYAKNLTEVKARLVEAFEKIMSNLTVGTASSASINSVMGGGVTIRTYYQTVHNPYGSQPGQYEVKWIGGAYALFVDPYGNLREDTNQNGLLDMANTDKIVEFVNCLDFEDAALLKSCSDTRDKSELKSPVMMFADTTGRNDVVPGSGTFSSLENVKTVWNLGQNLAAYNSLAALTSGRKVYFYQEGVSGTLPLQLGAGSQFQPDKGPALAKYLRTGSSEASRLIEYVLGWDQTGLRSRQTLAPWTPKGQITCRLGDIINAQPIILGLPFSGFDQLYGDKSFGSFRTANAGRRNAAFIGANDGMLHALNLGTHVSYSSGKNGYIGSDGREMWAFIPQSILPHLQWLARDDYAHSYYMDLTPFVAEVKDSSGNWRTLLLASLRFGGRSIEVEAATKSSPAKYSYSEVFALDVSDPERPVLQWRFSHPQLGLAVARPAVSREGASWNVIVGSGPTYDIYDPVSKTAEPGPEGSLAYRGYSNQSAKLFVFDALSGPGPNNNSVTVIDSKRPSSFIAQSFLAVAPPSSVVRNDAGVQWSNKLAYFSLVQSAPDSRLLCLRSGDTDPYLDSEKSADYCRSSDKFANYGYLDKGGVWRLYMDGPPSGWANNFRVLFDAEKPVSGSVNATSDSQGNIWVIFGTGRYYHDEDSRLCEGAGNNKACRVNHLNYLYGIKEPVDPVYGTLLQTEVQDYSLTDVSNIYVYPDGSIRTLGSGNTVTSGHIAGGVTLNSYYDLSKYLLSDKSGGYKKLLHTDIKTAVDSAEMTDPDNPVYKDTDWWKGLSTEMLIQQPAIAMFWGQSHMAFSTFLPENISCGSAGTSYHILLDTFTGLPSPVMGSAAFKAMNETQSMFEVGDEPVSDHYGRVAGLNVQTTAVTTVVNGSAKTAFVTTTSSGVGGSGSTRHSGAKKQDYVEPIGDRVQGVLSWREVLDFTLQEDTSLGED
ncbi:MAG: hypothetical protein LBK52_03805 [Deltaproteobacteria bacterium]|jgi:hypothetical protein|nr:hypothetical protein [Deltaproteobacteria bacterium]